MNTRLFEVCFSHLDEMSYSHCVSQSSEISSNTVTCAVTRKRVNQGDGCEIAKLRMLWPGIKKRKPPGSIEETAKE